jgi:class 3 adenylate cyclase/tetratricopeptide (TPR) repeat protein
LICPYCQHVNRETANFCLNCGQAISVICERCDTRLPVLANFCDHCGLQVADQVKPIIQLPPIKQIAAAATSEAEPQQPTQHAESESKLSKYIPRELVKKLNSIRNGGGMVAERRVVTILFCDIKGSTAAAERLDPEDWTEIINTAFEYMIKPVYEYEGTVARLMGDAILAFFGAPIAHEDDPQRAVLAGLDIVSGIQSMRGSIQERFGTDINVRVGINTGMVVVGAVGSDLRMEYTAMGDAINVASRMEQSAEPGTIQITEDTHRLITPFFEFIELGGIEVKGKSEPMLTYRVLGRKLSSGRLRGIAGMEAPLIGHDRDLSHLQDVLIQLDLGVGRLVTVIGDAGLGKSRIIDEVMSHWQENNEGINFYQVNSLSYETNQAYGLLRRLFRRVIDIGPEESNHANQENLNLFLAEDHFGETPPAKHVFQIILGLDLDDGVEPLEGEAFKRELYTAAEQLFSGLFTNQPTVFVFEDVHWADSASIELLIHLFPLVEQLPLVMIFSFRPDRQLPSWTLKTQTEESFHHRYSEILIKPLSEEEGNALLNHLLSIADIPDALRERVIDRAAGNPFFIEEIVRTLVEDGILFSEQIEYDGEKQVYWRASTDAAKVQIPENLHTLLMARIDSLDDDLRQTLQLASVIGRTFSDQVLLVLAEEDHIDPIEVGDHLNKLLRLEMLYEVSRQPEVEYGFRTPLIQEMAYGSILNKRRRLIHQRVGKTLQRLYPDQINDLAAQLGFHYSQADNHELSLKFYTIAGDNAFKLYANSLAITHFHAALTEARTNPVDHLEQIQYLYNRIGRALELESRFQEAMEIYSEELTLARELESHPLELKALVSLGNIYTMASDIANPEMGETYANQALELAVELNDKEAQAQISWILLNMFRFVGRYQEAKDSGERGLKLAEEIGSKEILAYIYNDLPYAYFGLFEIDKSVIVLNQAIELWRELDNQPMLADSLASASFPYAYLGMYDQAIAASDEAKEISESINNPWGIGYSRFYVGSVFEDRGLIDHAIRDYEITYSMGNKAGFIFGELWGKARLAHLYKELNVLDQAEHYLEQVTEFSEDNPGLLNLYSSMITLNQVSLLLAQGDIDKAYELYVGSDFEDALANSLVNGYVLVVSVEVMLAKGENETALQYCEKIIEKLTSSKNKSMLHQIYLLKGIAHLRMNEYELAGIALSDALQVAEDLGSLWRLWQILLAQAELEDKLKNPQKAASLRGEAVEHIEAICAEISQPEIRESFLNRPEVKALMSYKKNLLQQ